MILSGSKLFGQDNIARFLEDSKSNRFEITYGLHLGSNQFDLEFLSQNYWEDAAKKDQLSRQPSLSKLGIVHHAGAKMILTNPSSKDSKYIRLGYQDAFGLSIDPDLMSIALLGNRQFKGQTISIQSSNFQTIRTMSLVVGKTIHRESSFFNSVSYGLGLASGISSNHIQSETGTVQFDSLNEFVEMSSNFDAVKTNKDFSGLGLVSDLAFKHESNNYSLQIAVEDLGVIWWNNSTEQRNTSSPVTFEGFYISDINNLEGNWIDTFESNNLSKENTSKLYLSPFRIRSALKVATNQTSFIDLAVDYSYYQGLIPHGSARFGKKLSNSELGLGIAYGGYGSLRSSWQSRHILGGKAMLSLRLEGVESLLTSSLPMNARGSMALAWHLRRSDHQLR